MQKLPPKIQNLYILQKIGFIVPCFVVIDSEKFNKIDEDLGEIINFFEKRKVKSIIIRSASFLEDLKEKSMAGFFKSSLEIETKDLNSEKIKYYWNKNKRKIKQNNPGNFFIFIQEFFVSDYSGVLFTESPYDVDQALLSISSSFHAITDGLSPSKKIIYHKERNQWEDADFLNKNIKKDFEKLIFESKKYFPEGSDIELGVKKDKLKIYQIRPITRNKNEKILLQEKKRLKKKFKDDFEKQVWIRNDFVQGLGKISPLSLKFYNDLLLSKELSFLLQEAKIIDRENNEKSADLLENIGGRLYFNIIQEKKVFFKKNNWWNNFKRHILILSYEKIMSNKATENKKKSLENSFSWFFLSGIYFKLFLEQDKRKCKVNGKARKSALGYKVRQGIHKINGKARQGELRSKRGCPGVEGALGCKKEFFKRLKNTEIACSAEEPRPKSLSDKNIKLFIAKYYYFSDQLYELSAERIFEQDKNKIKEKYSYFPPAKKQTDERLSSKTEFWLKNKVLYKQKFLKLLFENREKMFKKYNKNFFNISQNIKYKGEISDFYSEISGENYPFGLNDRGNKEIIIVPGKIKIKELHFLGEGVDIKKYFGKFIAVLNFPSSWIPYISKFEGIILQEGNELSHMAITCREYGIPCKIIPDLFKKK